MKLERPVCSVEMEHSLLSHLEELCPLVLGVGALHSSSEKVLAKRLRRSLLEKSSLAKSNLESAFFIVAEDEVEGCSFLVEGLTQCSEKKTN